MKKKLILISLLSFAYIVHNNISAQTQNTADLLNKQASIPIPSPNVAALNKFVEYPVNLFNGQADVSIPVYEIKLKNLSVPISLKYHTGGIRVSEEASWVGLGWALDAGGVISHQVKGLNDLVYGNYDQHYLPYLDKSKNETYNDNVALGTVAINPLNCCIPNNNGVMENISNKFWRRADINFEPDLYIYNTGTYSGKFINMGTPIDLSNNNMKFIQYTGINPAGDSIVATDPEGNLYKFKDVETSFSPTSLEESIRYNTSAYYLSEIISSNGENIKFYYKSLQQLITENQWQSQFPDYGNGLNPTYQQNGCFPLLPALFEESYLIYEASVPNFVSSHAIRSDISTSLSCTYCKTIYLDKITFPNGEINFKKSPRLDTYGVKLDKIEIKNSLNQTVKIYDFAYGYFDTENNPYGYDVTTANSSAVAAFKNYPTDYLGKRLKLISFSESLPNNNKNEVYSFTYNETYKLPYKTSFAQDFWGYYNGSLNKTLLPSYSIYSKSLSMDAGFGQGKASTVLTANRNVNKLYNQAGMLKEITLPTKGKTSFEYEPNDCNNSFVSSSSIERKFITAIDYGVGFGYEEFTFTNNQKVTIDIIFGNGRSIPVQQGISSSSSLGQTYANYSGFYAVIEKYNSSMNRFEHFDPRFLWRAYDELRNSPDPCFSTTQLAGIELPSGRYRVTASFPDDQASKGAIGSTFTQISVIYETTIVSTKNLVGGLRIQSITHTDNIASKPAITKNYKYSSGTLVSAPQFVSGYFCSNPDLNLSNYNYNSNPDAFKVSVSANPTIAYSYSANGGLVGYQNVEEVFSSGEIGKINYTYKVSPDNSSISSRAMPPNIPYISKLTNGFLTSKTVYNSSNIYIYKQIFQPVIVNSKVYWGLIVDPRFLYLQITGIVPSDMCLFTNQNYFYFYPIIQGKLLSESMYEEDYRQGVIPPVQKTTNYVYNNYCQLISKKIDDSSPSGTVIETYKYVPEKAAESGGVYTQMRTKNIISPLIETLTNHNGSITKQVTNYFQPYTNIFTPSSFQLQFGSNAIETRITYDKYDKYGNPNSINKDNAGPVIYLWGYNYQYPIAKIENATFTEAEAAAKTVFGIANVDALSALATPNETKLQDGSLQRALPNALVTTYTYKPLVGMLTMTDPRGIVTYFEYDNFGRLKESYYYDNNDKTKKRIVETYEYHYKN